MASWQGLLDRLGDPNNPQVAGLLGGLTQFGATLAQAGQMRPLGQPGPGIGDAFGAFSTGQRQGLLNSYQSSQMAKQQQRAALLAAARDTSRPDETLRPDELAARKALSGLGPDIAALADDQMLPGLVVDRAKSQQRVATPEEAATYGVRPGGSAVMINPFTGAMSQAQASDIKSREREEQDLRMSIAGRAPRQAPVTWSDVVGPDGSVTGQRSSLGQLNPFNTEPKPVNEGNSWNTILRLAPKAAGGSLDPGSKEGRDYLAAQTVLTKPQPVDIVRPDGSVERVWRPPEFPFPRLSPPHVGPGAPPAAGGDVVAPTVAAGAPVALGSVAAPPAGVTVKAAPPLTESQANATMYVTRMREAENRLESVVGSGYAPGGLRDALAARGGMAGNATMSESGQLYKQAQEDWVRAKLRKESGAVIAADEMRAEIVTYFPQPGDSASVIKQKADARETATRALGSVAGRAGAVPPPPATGGATMIWNPATGKAEAIR